MKIRVWFGRKKFPKKNRDLFVLFRFELCEFRFQLKVHSIRDGVLDCVCFSHPARSVPFICGRPRKCERGMTLRPNTNASRVGGTVLCCGSIWCSSLSPVHHSLAHVLKHFCCSLKALMLSKIVVYWTLSQGC